MAGGGHIIIRSAIKAVLTDPIVHGTLPIPQLIDPILAKDVNEWNEQETCTAGHYFNWALNHS